MTAQTSVCLKSWLGRSYLTYVLKQAKQQQFINKKIFKCLFQNIAATCKTAPTYPQTLREGML